MRARRGPIGACVLSSLALAASFGWSASVRGQVNLPPPPPPPLSTNNPPPPPPPGQGGGGGGTSSGGTARPRPRGTTEHAATPQREEPRDTFDADAYASRRWSIRLNPLPLFLARLSVDVEYQLAPHHAIVAAPHFTFRGHRAPLPSRAFGYTFDDSVGIGTEAGYHYWIAPRMEGLWLGPSVLLGASTHPVADNYLYYGVAFDVGYQLMLSNGFTIGGGGGLLLVGAGGGNALHVTPRFLLGVGWSF